MPTLPRGPVLFGAAYYAEYQPYERLKSDLDLMVEANFTVIRVGESVWSTWEPRDGVFDLDWLQPVLDGAAERGIDVVVGTPTYAVPPWLRRKYPETAAHRRTGAPVSYGARQDINHPHPAFRFLAERVIRKIVERYADHPAVIGWQVDNEPGINHLHNPDVFQGFVGFLKDRYGDVDTLNERWGLVYWSHRISDWADLWTPDGNTTPSYDLAWRRYQAALTHEYIGWQTELVRSLIPGHQFVTTCLALHQPTQDVAVIGEPLDIVATNIYYGTQDDLALPSEKAVGRGRGPSFLPWSGTAWLYLQADISRGTRQAPFLVTETNASSIGGSADNFPAYSGQWRQVVWSLVARGARMVEYWHWHSLHFGAETYWGGILGHSLEPGRTYHELATVAGELKQAAAELQDLQPQSDVAVLVSAESRWAMEFMAPLQGGVQAWTGDPKSYERILAAFYRGLFDVGLAVDVVSPAQLPDDASAVLARWPVLVVPGLYIADDTTLELLRAYAEAGGHLVLTPRTGYADEEAVVRHTTMPGALREAAGAYYLEFTNLVHDVPVSGRPSPSGGPTVAGQATGWADGLIADGATVLAGYDHPHLGQFAAATTNAYGQGRVTYVGTVPDADLARSLAGWVADTSLPGDPWRQARPPSVTCTSARNSDGSTVRFVHNWSWEPAEVVVPAPVRDLLDGTELPAAEALSLGPWGARVIIETRDTSMTTAGEESAR